MTNKAEQFTSQEELQSKYPKAEWHEYGPILTYGGEDYVQVYLGQHQWIIIKCEDTSMRYEDEGCIGTVKGWGYVPWSGWDDIQANPGVNPDGFTETVDQALFGKKE